MSLSPHVKGWPVVIEPMADSLEVVGHAEHTSPATVRLKRVPTHVVLTHFQDTPPGLVHFFGWSADFANNSFLLGYTSNGLLQYFFLREAGQWQATHVAAELTGSPCLAPSIRLVFKDERGRDGFLHYLRRVKEGRIVNPSIAVALDRLAESIRVIDVWRQE